MLYTVWLFLAQCACVHTCVHMCTHARVYVFNMQYLLTFKNQEISRSKKHFWIHDPGKRPSNISWTQAATTHYVQCVCSLVSYLFTTVSYWAKFTHMHFLPAFYILKFFIFSLFCELQRTRKFYFGNALCCTVCTPLSFPYND